MADRTRTRQVADFVRQQIALGELNSGGRVKERELADRLGVSRGPVREAFRLLEREGLLEVRPYAGASVVRVDRSEIQEIVSLRRQVEQFAIVDATLAADPAVVSDLRNLVEEMREAHTSQDPMRLIDLDLRFHLRICTASGHQTLVAVMRTLLPRLMILGSPQLFRGHTSDSFAASHLRFVNALANRDVEAALEAVDAHIQNFSIDLERRLEGNVRETFVYT